MTYAMIGKLTAQTGRRADLVEALKRAAELVAGMSGCHLYLVHVEAANEANVWVYEMWDEKESHDASLKDERVRALIAQAMPLLGGAPEGTELKFAGGYGIDK